MSFLTTTYIHTYIHIYYIDIDIIHTNIHIDRIINYIAETNKLRNTLHSRLLL